MSEGHSSCVAPHARAPATDCPNYLRTLFTNLSLALALLIRPWPAIWPRPNVCSCYCSWSSCGTALAAELTPHLRVPCSYRSAEGGPASVGEGEDDLVFEDDFVLPTMSPARPGTDEVASAPQGGTEAS